jgi:hypothetical protein
MDLRKYASKLSKMSPDEIVFRVRQQTRNRLEKFRWRLNGKSAIHHLFVPAYLKEWDFHKFPFPDNQLRFFGLDQPSQTLRQVYRFHFSHRLEKTVQQADELLAHRFHFLGLDVQLANPIPWSRNPQTGLDYPKLHHWLMDTFNTDLFGDVKYAWELNRHQFFIEVAKAYFLTGDEKYSRKTWRWLESWIFDNPYKIGINHTSVLEHAVRIFSWVWAFYFTRESAIWTRERREILARHLLLQGEIIEKNLSYYYSPYNHLIGELAALSLLGTVYGNAPKMRIWREKYWRELERQIDKQFHEDGFTVEQASYYHHFTLGFYVMLALLRRQNGLSVSEKTWQMLERAIELPLYLTRPGQAGQLPMLGDIDSARSIYFYQPEKMWDLRFFQALGAVVFRRGDMKFIAGEAPEEILWLTGLEGLNTYNTLPAQLPEHTSRAFFKSGYYIMRDGWDKQSNYLLFDCGKIAHGVFRDETPSAAHGHADILSFELSINGQPLVIDPGFFTYFGPLEWHRYFRSTRGHNTIEVNGAGQALHQNRLGWSNVSSPKLDHWLTTPALDFTGGSIDRFAGLADKIQHRRYILFRKNLYFLVMDEVIGGEGGTSYQIESSFHFAPGELAYDNKQVFYNGKFVAQLSIPATVAVHIENGGEKPEQGWMAEGYGHKIPAPVMRLLARQSLPLHWAMLFPLPEIRAEVSQIRTVEVKQEIHCHTIIFAGGLEKVYLNPRQKTFSLLLENSVETDALCVVEKHSEDQEKEIYVVKVNHLVVNQQKVNSRLSENGTAFVRVQMNRSGVPDVEIWKREA